MDFLSRATNEFKWLPSRLLARDLRRFETGNFAHVADCAELVQRRSFCFREVKDAGECRFPSHRRDEICFPLHPLLGELFDE